MLISCPKLQKLCHSKMIKVYLMIKIFGSWTDPKYFDLSKYRYGTWSQMQLSSINVGDIDIELGQRCSPSTNLFISFFNVDFYNFFQAYSLNDFTNCFWGDRIRQIYSKSKRISNAHNINWYLNIGIIWKKCILHKIGYQPGFQIWSRTHFK